MAALFSVACYIFVALVIVSKTSQHITVLPMLSDVGNVSSLANSSENIPCSHYAELSPDTNRTELDKECKIMFTPSSQQYFTYKVLKFKYRFVHFRLNFLNQSQDSQIHYTKCVIEPLEWIWTFLGVEGNYGGRQYLDWPPEFDVMSMGMLTTYTSPPLKVNLTVDGECDIVIGSVNTTMRLALAFANFTNDLMMTQDEYNYSYWCYKERIFVDNYLLYQICLHVICPIETIGYRCCKQMYDVTVRKYVIRCPGHFYTFDGVWWVCPFVIGFVLYLYFALMLFSILSAIYKHLPDVMETRSHNYVSLVTDESYKSKVKWIHHNTVTVFSILVMPLRKCCLLYSTATSRILRFLVVISSLTVILIKVIVHSYHNRPYIIESVKQGAPMNFLSMISGYSLSRGNFLIYLGGPYVALGLYLMCCFVLVCLPSNLSEFLSVGLPEKTNNPNFILTIDLKQREQFGSRRIIAKGRDGYMKIQKTFLANIFCLLNPKFWKRALLVQTERFKNAIETHDSQTLYWIKLVLLLLPYLTFCLIELIMTLMCYGFPTVFAIGLVYRAYCRNMNDFLGRKGKTGFAAMFVVLPGCVLLLTFTVYMFSIIFLDSFIFLSRIAIFTYTGLFANPSYTEGYLVFSLTVTMYLYDSIHSINETYERLFNQTKKVCKRVRKDKSQNFSLYRKDIEGAAIPIKLYLFIVDTYKPKRVEILKSVVKIIAIFLCLYISVGILTSFDGFQQLSVVTQTATTTFVCLVPKIFARMCSLNERRAILRMRDNIHECVKTFYGEEKAYICENHTNANTEQSLSGPSFKFL